MDDIRLSWLFAALAVLLLLSAFFSIAETAMMAINRYRLKHLVTHGDTSAMRVADLLKRLALHSDAHLVVRGDQILTRDVKLTGEDRVEIWPVISGGR